MATHESIISALGGIAETARLVGVPPRRATHWTRRGIPSKYWHIVIKKADPAKLTVSIEDLAASKPSTGKVA